MPAQGRAVPGWVRDVERAAEITETTTVADDDAAVLVAAARRILAVHDPQPTPDEEAERRRQEQALAAAAICAGTVAGAMLRSPGRLQGIGWVTAAAVIARRTSLNSRENH